jgi:hypothetical protein
VVWKRTIGDAGGGAAETSERENGRDGGATAHTEQGGKVVNSELPTPELDGPARDSEL